MDLSAYAVTGTNDASKQVSVTRWNNLLGAIEGGTANQPINPLDYGIVEGSAAGANGAANSVAFAAMLADLRTRAVNVYTFYQGLERIVFPTGYFEFAETWDITDGTLIIEGQDTGYSSAHGTLIKWPAGVTGIRIQRYNTSGASTLDGVTHRGSDGTVIRGFTLRGGYAGTEGEFHGIQLRAKAIIENCYIESFQGDGIYGWATSGGGVEGNTNYSLIQRVTIVDCRNGIYIDGADSNIWTIINADCNFNRQWNFWDSSFLGNTYVGTHSSGGGLVPGGTPSIVTHAGNRYYVIAGQAVGASTNAPSGTTADNTWWAFQVVGGASGANNIAAWLSGTTYREGGAYRTDSSGARNHFSGCYIENGQAPAQMILPTTVVGGNLASSTIRGNPTILSGSRLEVETGEFNSALVTASDPSGTIFKVHQQQDYSSAVRSRSGLAIGYEADGVTPALFGAIGAYGGGASIATAVGGLKFLMRASGGALAEHATMVSDGFYPDNNNVMTLGVSSLRFSTAYAYTGDFTTQVKVNGVKVLGAQGAAVANPTGGATVDTEARAQLSLALAALRTHGLIAT